VRRQPKKTVLCRAALCFGTAHESPARRGLRGRHAGRYEVAEDEALIVEMPLPEVVAHPPLLRCLRRRLLH
jgi:hypothetical protein